MEEKLLTVEVAVVSMVIVVQLLKMDLQVDQVVELVSFLQAAMQDLEQLDRDLTVVQEEITTILVEVVVLGQLASCQILDATVEEMVVME